MLNPAICAMFMFQGFQHEVSRLTALSVANPIPLTFNCDSIQTMICETLAGGEIECAHWMLDAAEQICKACEPAYQASEEPGVWYYDIAERLGAEVACRCVKGDISTDQLVAVAVNLTESWNTLSEDSNQEPDCGSYENTVRTLVERADTAEAACVEAVRILDGGERQALSKAIAILRPVAATLQ
ncbi:TPA: hypothetical protein ACNV4H_003749 [Citrobacter freundii]|jgi:hypothetical protein|uniref:Uncharacterized protein n=1 Tax=Citrobacter freundii TaxID=546 RepID=A0A2R4AKH1_CITFR|nr:MULTISPECIES: hypothetical protein [Enterobacteriaceae]EBQ6262211.1 hypothetical protein [Salmonella enterica subsp. enterica serovar Virchow]ECE8705181.1 hypothetical protein [Salmonella enterica subsp. enterica serovar Saintpaul]EGQ1255074.1 hypothetical protein [Salmonella enterica subsp. enterica]EHE5260938.1 hypothetical protein [Salmonella enterica]MCL8667077.1 hypothetical protein [Salmonella enterica subsp. enterica serovar Enteritidis]HAT2611107.1 hypothetical protein [Kluyvera in